MARVIIRIAGDEVAKWAAGRTVRPDAPALPSGRVVVLALDAPVVRDTEGVMRDVATLDADANLEVAVLGVNQATRIATIRVALELADVALGGLVERATAVQVDVEA